MYVYIQTEAGLWTTGFHSTDESKTWCPDKDFDSPEKAADRVAYLNAGQLNKSQLEKVKKWDQLHNDIAEFYAPEFDEAEALGTIGEMAASAFGFLSVLILLLIPSGLQAQNCSHHYDDETHLSSTLVFCSSDCCNEVLFTCITCHKKVSVNECNLYKHHISYNSTEYFTHELFALRDSIEIRYNDLRTVDKYGYIGIQDLEQARELRNYWFYLNFKIQCIQTGTAFDWEDFTLQRIKQRISMGNFADMIEEFKIPNPYK